LLPHAWLGGAIRELRFAPHEAQRHGEECAEDPKNWPTYGDARRNKKILPTNSDSARTRYVRLTAAISAS
jgi:hypothetical protein